MTNKRTSRDVDDLLAKWGVVERPDAEVSCGEDVVIVVDGPVAIVILDRPPVNALSVSAYEELTRVFRDLGARDGLSAVIVGAAGTRAFCGGADIGERQRLGPDESARRERERVVDDFYRELGTLPIPTIAAIDGPCVGSGAVAVSLMDIRIATTASWFALPEIDVRVCGGGRHLMRLLPIGIVRELALTGRRLEVVEAHRLGFINQLVDTSDLARAACDCAARLAQKDRATLVATKQTLRLVEEMSLAEGFSLEQRTTYELGMLDAEGNQ